MNTLYFDPPDEPEEPPSEPPAFPPDDMPVPPTHPDFEDEDDD
jgi:hypothetical protein